MPLLPPSILAELHLEVAVANRFHAAAEPGLTNRPSGCTSHSVEFSQPEERRVGARGPLADINKMPESLNAYTEVQ